MYIYTENMLSYSSNFLCSSNRLPFVPLGHASIADVLTLPLTVASLGLLFDAEVKFTLTFCRAKRSVKLLY